jgi:hypothetical protein
MYPSSKYSFVKFEKAAGTKKYNAILRNKETKREVKVGFGAKGYEHYKDKALGSYSSQNHGDAKRRASYRARHKGEGDPSRKYSAGWFAWHYLW